ncbi:MAG TPA: VOC family protein [Pararobbsia sp.]|nr:VOC family protein [Pararobbsia sp.]
MNTSPSTAIDRLLDHIVVNVMFDIDAAASCFAGLGFALTPRGYHSLGSVNHLMMFGDHYLELVGLPVGSTRLRREILESRLGIDGLVFRTDDARATHSRLRAACFNAAEPQSFSRPVMIDGVEQLAKFATTRLEPGELAAGRVYFCEHLTPQWVFRDEWTTHPNGAKRLAELVVVSPQPDAEAQRYARIAGEVGATATTEGAGIRLSLRGFDLRFVDEASYRARYGPLACHAADRADYFGALVVEVADLHSVREKLTSMARDDPAAAQVARATTDDGAPAIRALLRPFNTLIEFIGTADHAHS